MKKLSIFALAALLAAGFSACSDAKTQAQVANGVAGDTSKNAAAAGEMKLPADQAEAEALAKTTVEFSETEYNFGMINAGTKVKHTFKVKNTGTSPLKLTNVKPTCGCTASDYTKEEIAPGKEGVISVEFNSSGKMGMQRKGITVTGNFSDGLVKSIFLVGEVK
jgi:hypothetical protein